MMRELYVKPEIVVVEFSPIFILSMSMTIDKTSKGDSEEDFAQGRRGAWGDLWVNNNENKVTK